MTGRTHVGFPVAQPVVAISQAAHHTKLCRLGPAHMVLVAPMLVAGSEREWEQAAGRKAFGQPEAEEQPEQVRVLVAQIPESWAQVPVIPASVQPAPLALAPVLVLVLVQEQERAWVMVRQPELAPPATAPAP